MKAGDSIQCPHCGKNSFLKKESVMDGWTKKGEVFKCAFCSAFIADVPAETAEAAPEKGKLNKLASLLGEDVQEKKTLKADSNDFRFCKDCKFVVKHPFRLLCSRTDRTVEPMEDCAAFVRAEKPEEKA